MLRFSNKAASMTVSRPGAIPAMPSLAELEKELSELKKKVSVLEKEVSDLEPQITAPSAKGGNT